MIQIRIIRRTPGGYLAPCRFLICIYQFLTGTQHGYRHVITLKSAAFIREIAIKSLPLHYKQIANQSRTNQQY
ncbi:MAG: hypothetical protein ACM680_13545, partial [Enterobacteriaceae bacterium]